MIVAAHQPMYMPWLGFFHKWLKSDLFVFLDDVEYISRDFFNRNMIKTDQGGAWLSVPISHQSNERPYINEVKINNGHNWFKKHWGSLRFYYGKAQYFDRYREFFEQIYNKEWDDLLSLNVTLLKFFSNELKVNVDTTYSSSMNITEKATRRLINICKKVGADTYLSGIGAKAYLETELFDQEGIRLVFQEFQHPVYPQLFGDFIPNMSVTDLLLNCGPEDSSNIIKGC
ncbi:WbqC family protein [Candidatus Omnitrophota bacterium]